MSIPLGGGVQLRLIDVSFDLLSALAVSTYPPPRRTRGLVFLHGTVISLLCRKVLSNHLLAPRQPCFNRKARAMVGHLATGKTLTKEEAKRLALATNGIDVRSVGLAELDTTIIQTLLAELPVRHHLDGVASLTSVPLLVFQLLPTAASKSLRPKTTHFLPYGWTGQFGGMLTITAWVSPEDRKETVQTQVWIPRGHEAFENLKAGRFTAVFAYNRRAVFAYAVDFTASTHSNDWFDEQWGRVIGHLPFLPDNKALYWEILDQRTDSFDKSLTATDRLSLGWVRSYALAATELCSLLTRAKNAGGFPAYHDAGLPSLVVSFLEAIEAAQFRPKPALDHMASVHDSGDEKLLQLLQGESAFQLFAHANSEHTHCSLLGSFYRVYARSARMTRCGTAVPWADFRDGFAIRHLDLKPKEFPKAFAPNEYWSRIPEGSLLPTWGHLIKGNDVPLSSGELATAWATLPLAENVQEVSASADAMLDEAVANKKWTIPTAATVELRFGPFTHMQVSEINTGVHFVCRTATGEFYIIFLEPDIRYCSFVLADVPGAEPDRRARVQEGVKLLLSAIIRDFWVVEEREAVFSHRVITERLPGEEAEPTGPRIVYLPRIRYVDRPNLDRCTSELDHRERRAHFVRAHDRRVERPSEHQLFFG